MSKLFISLQIRNLTLKNRIVMPPMCQYSAKDGLANDWHLVHYGSRAVGGCGAIIVEATAVSPEGRITYADLGLWNDAQIAPLQKVASFIEKNGTIPGIQLAHAGRKASENVSWEGNGQIKEGSNGWQTISASAIPFDQRDMTPKELTREEIKEKITNFKLAAQRAKKAGFKIIEIHAAHGYLIHQFLSPISNNRTDEYGGSFENRIRFLLEIIDALLPEKDDNHSLWVRISATDWVDGGWNEDEAVKLSQILKDRGVDVMDVSTGGNVPHAKIPVGLNYQVPFAERIKKEAGIVTSAVGLITEPKHANRLLDENKCDIVMIGRELLRDPYFAINAEKDLGESLKVVHQYERAF